MKEKLIVLRRGGALSRDVFRGPSFESAAPPEVKVEIEEVERREIPAITRNADVAAVAPPMPMKLIAPLDAHAATPAEATDIAWGVRAVKADTSSFTGDGIVVAVLDTGIDPAHPAFEGVELLRRNFTDESDDDEHGHGTHCAGTIFGRKVGSTRIGVAPGVKRALIGKVLGEGGGSSEQIVSAIQWAVENGANVISMSLGIDFPGFVDLLVNQQGLNINPATSIALEQYRANVNLFSALAASVEAQGAFGQGAVIVAASGNESNRPSFEIAVAPPAAGTGVLAVGALQEGATGFSVASFSNNQVDVSAPGVAVISAKLGGGLVAKSGTSMATPHVAGVAALWAQKLKQETGGVESPTLLAQLVAKAVTAPLQPGFEEDDVGTGIVQAPLS